MKYSFLALVLTLCIIQPAYSQKYKFEKEPVWIKKVEIPQKSTFNKYDITSGFYLALADYQINLDEDAYYTHEVINVVSYSGITNASQLSITYDTSYQKLKIHHLYVWRKGEKINRTSDLSFEVMNNEYNLHNGIYMGSITAYDNLNDVRKDDLLDFSYTLVGKNPIFGKEKYLFTALETTNPIDRFVVRVLYSKDKDYAYKCNGCDSINFSNTLVGNYRQLEITAKDVKASSYEDHIPSWVIPYKYFVLSSLKTWKDVNIWAQGVFALQKEPKLENVFKEIFTGNETTDDKINKIIDYVQDDIRYMGIESGIGSIKPFAPEQVVKQRFGDCKDKSLLLVSLLKNIGIKEAYPALVNTHMLQEVDQLMPSNQIFNHCIVKFEYEKRTYWVDPTITQQGGDYKNLSIYDYGKALVIGIPSDTIPLMAPTNPKSIAFLKDEITVRSFTEPATLVINTKRNGLEADQRRYLLEQYSTTEMSKLVTEDLKLLFPVVNKTEEMKISDDIKSNTISTTYHYELDGFWQDGDKKDDADLAGYWMFRYEPQTLYQYLNTSACSERKHDYGLAYPLNLEYQVVFHFPKDMLITDSYKKEENEAFYYDERTEQLSKSSFQVTYKFNTKKTFIKAGDYEKICEQKNKIVKVLPIVIYFRK
jgi:transglutaminase-like putative cysteine protease